MYVGETIVCRFWPSVTQTEIDDLMNQYHLEIVEENEYMSGEYLIRVTPESPLSTMDMANEFYDISQTHYSHPNFYCPMILDGYAVEDEYYNLHQWNVKSIVSRTGYENAAWEISAGDTSIYICVIDQGIEPHEDFRREKFWYGLDVLPYGGFCLDTFPRPKDTLEAHGMSVLGLISAEHNNPLEGLMPDDPGAYQSVAGMAPKCRAFGVRIMGYKFTYISHYRVAFAISFAFRNGGDLINCSWTWMGGPSDAIENAIDSTHTYGRNGLGTLIIFSSGNYGRLTGGYQIHWPKTKENVLAVGAIDAGDQWYDYSCYGDALDLVAPSGPIFDSNYTGGGMWTTDRIDILGDNPLRYNGCQPVNDIDYRCNFGGTSAAAPLVTGTAALVLSRRPDLTVDQLMDVLKGSAVRDLQWGSVTPGDPKYGHGRINALRALVAVARGDVNNDGDINVADAVYLLTYIFRDGPPPIPHVSIADANCDEVLNVGDAVYLINYVFKGGDAPPISFVNLP